MNTTTIILLVMLAITIVVHVCYEYYWRTRTRKKLIVARLVNIFDISVEVLKESVKKGVITQEEMNKKAMIIAHEINSVIRETGCSHYAEEVYHDIQQSANERDKNS